MNLSITLIIIITTVAVSLYANGKPELYSKLLFNPYQVFHRKEWYRIFSHAFIHDNNNIFHLGFNMYVLYVFGNGSQGDGVEFELIEKMGGIGIFYFLLIYLGGVFVATIPALLKHRDNYNYNSVGASGAVSAVLFSMVAMHPISSRMGIIFLPMLPAIVFGVLYIAYEKYMEKRGGTNIAHDAHIWGAVFGFLFTLIFVPDAFVNFISEVLGALGY
ncbi:MAG: rhomboid family intramembrane serine protease [Flavobacteriales bacterium]|nr:MAG: rhomboid family intramembrane serine protease [Flavobacteriales bacterium]